MNFTIDPQLRHDCFVLGQLGGTHVLLLDNAALPWFVLVPETHAIELCDLSDSEMSALQQQVLQVSRLVRAGLPGSPAVDKLNVAAIGNIVRQLHVHVVGRNKNDYCWPGVVWGAPVEQRYTPAAVKKISDSLGSDLEGFASV